MRKLLTRCKINNLIEKVCLKRYGFFVTEKEMPILKHLLSKMDHKPYNKSQWSRLIFEATNLASQISAGHALAEMLSKLEPDEIDENSGAREFYLGPIFLSQQSPEFFTALARAGWKYGDSVIQNWEAVTIVHSDRSPIDTAQEFLQALVQRWGEAVDGDEAMDSGDVIEWLGQAVREARLILGEHPTKGT